jgi:hypothetical protein
MKTITLENGTKAANMQVYVSTEAKAKQMLEDLRSVGVLEWKNFPRLL